MCRLFIKLLRKNDLEERNIYLASIHANGHKSKSAMCV